MSTGQDDPIVTPPPKASVCGDLEVVTPSAKIQLAAFKRMEASQKNSKKAKQVETYEHSMN